MNFLEEIVLYKRQEVAARKLGHPVRSVPDRLCKPGHSLRSAITGGSISVMAEVKKASPSRGLLREGLDPALLAQSYEANGASAISVLTESHFFRAGPEDLFRVREATDLPVLRKDFIIDPYQLEESKSLRADAVLLIAAILTKETMREFLVLAKHLGMQCLVEVHDTAELEAALEAGAEIIGINNRDLSSFRVELGTSFALRPYIPPGKTVVSESGICRREDVLRLEQAGFDAVLVGECLVRAPDPGAKLRELLGG